jgi:transposase
VALKSQGPVPAERLSPAQWARLEAELRREPLAHGFADDQRWTLSRVKTLIGRLFHVGYTVQGTWKLLRRHGWSCQVPVRQAMERDEAAIAVWKAQVWPETKSTARDLGAYVCFEDEAGQGLRPPKGRTWAPRGARPVVSVRAQVAGGSASPQWCVTGPGSGHGCSTSCGPTGAARVSRRASPGRTTAT